MLLHLPDDHGAVAVQEAIVAKTAELPSILRKTLTWDQGIEMTNHVCYRRGHRAGHLLLRPALSVAARQQQKHNGLLRQYFAKGTDCRCFRPTTSTSSPPNSTPDPAKPWASEHRPKPSTNYSQTRPDHPLLQSPRETAELLARPAGVGLGEVGLTSG